MYLNTIYKAFVAKAAAQLMTEMVSQAMASGKIDMDGSYKDNSQTYGHLATQAAFAAKDLAKELERQWDSTETVFFDPQDSLTSNLESEIAEVSSKLDDIVEVLKS